MVIEPNALETARFGIACARVTDPSAPLDEINAAAAETGVRMLVVRLPSEDLARVQRLEADGFRLMDTLVYYGRTLADLPDPVPGPVPGDETIRPGTPQDTEAVGAIAAAAFAGYGGHYHADPRLSDDAADAAYVDWAETCARGSGAGGGAVATPMLLAETAGGARALGFLSLRLGGAGMEDTADIVLNAVHPEAQGQGIYGRLLDRGLALCRAAGQARVTVSTQLPNLPVQRAWVRRGFRLERSLYTLHKWFD